MVPTRKKKQQSKRLLNQLSELETDFVIGQNNHGVQTENKVNVADKDISLGNTNNPAQVNHPQVDMHTLEENHVGKV